MQIQDPQTIKQSRAKQKQKQKIDCDTIKKNKTKYSQKFQKQYNKLLIKPH